MIYNIFNVNIKIEGCNGKILLGLHGHIINRLHILVSA